MFILFYALLWLLNVPQLLHGTSCNWPNDRKCVCAAVLLIFCICLIRCCSPISSFSLALPWWIIPTTHCRLWNRSNVKRSGSLPIYRYDLISNFLILLFMPHTEHSGSQRRRWCNRLVPFSTAVQHVLMGDILPIILLPQAADVDSRGQRERMRVSASLKVVCSTYTITHSYIWPEYVFGKVKFRKQDETHFWWCVLFVLILFAFIIVHCL